MSNCTWEKKDGIYICKAEKCTHWNNGCTLGKVSLSCDNNDCKYNKHFGSGIYRCMSMDIHLDADGKCLLMKDDKK